MIRMVTHGSLGSGNSHLRNYGLCMCVQPGLGLALKQDSTAPEGAVTLGSRWPVLGKARLAVSYCQMQKLTRILRSSCLGNSNAQEHIHPFFFSSPVLSSDFYLDGEWRCSISIFTLLPALKLMPFSILVPQKSKIISDCISKVLFSGLNPSPILKLSLSLPGFSYTTLYLLHFKWIIATKAYSAELFLNSINSGQIILFHPHTLSFQI